MMILLSFTVYGAEYSGTGYGSTNEEAKKEALADLSSAIKVQVFSKYEQTAVKNNNKANVSSVKFTKLSTNIPILSPSIYYSREKGKIKALAVIDKPQLYAEKLSELAGKINEVTKDVKENGDKSLNYRLLRSAQNLYDEYESYKSVADVLGVTGYAEPRISQGQAYGIIISMQETPPSLEIAAEVLTKDMTEKNIYVSPPVYAGSEEITEFGSLFKDLLAAKVNAVKVKEDGRYTLSCSYGYANKDIIMTCSLITGVSKVLKSSVITIPEVLVSNMSVRPKLNANSLLNMKDIPKTDYKINIKISTDGDPYFLRENEPFTLLIKANKPGYIYFVTVNNSADGEANILPLGWNDTFLKYIDENSVHKWISLGKFRVKAPFGSETLYAFGLERKPEREYILPDYAQKNIGYLKNVRPDALLYDVMQLFKRQAGYKTTTSITYTTAPNRIKK